MGKYFGDDGYRGEVNLTINPVFLYKIGRFLGWRCKNNLGQYTDVLPRIVIGKIHAGQAKCLNPQ